MTVNLHRAGLTARSTRTLAYPIPTPAQLRRQAITTVCAQIDQRLGNRRGTAERGLWFWLWPPHPNTSTEVLNRLHADAVGFLNDLTNTPKDHHHA